MDSEVELIDLTKSQVSELPSVVEVVPVPDRSVPVAVEEESDEEFDQDELAGIID